MLDIDRWTKGFGPQLSPRRIRIILTCLKGEPVLEEDKPDLPLLIEWFDSAVKENLTLRGLPKDV